MLRLLDEDDVQPKLNIPFLQLTVTFAIVLGYLWGGYLLGLCSFEVLYLSFGIIGKNVVYFILFGVGLFALLIYPIHQLLYPEYQENSTPGLRMILLILLLSPPILSFSYFRGGIRDLSDFHDMSLTVLPAVVVSSLFYERHRNAFLFAIILSLFCLVPIFFVSDILSSIPTPIHYFSESRSFYVLKSIVSIAAIWIYLGWDLIQYKTPFERLRPSYSYLAIILSLYSIIVKYAYPVLIAYFEKNNHYSGRVDFQWVGFLALAYFLQHWNRITYWLSFLFSVSMSWLLFFDVSRYLLKPDVSFQGISLWTNQAFTLIFLLTLFYFLSKKEVRLSVH